MDGINLCAAPLDIDPRQRYFTTVQPFSYRDTLTVLGYVQEVAEHVDELREQLDNLAKDEDADVEAIKQLIAGFDEQIAGFDEQFERINKTLDDLEKQVGQYEDSALTYNPTRGKYEDSKNTNRDMYRELAVFGARVNQMARLSTPMAAAHTCLEFAVLGNKTIFHNDEPRITPRDTHVDDGEPVNPLTVENLANGVVVNNFMKIAQ